MFTFIKKNSGQRVFDALAVIALAILLFGSGFGEAFAQASDKTAPDDVENVIAVGGDGQVTLSWDPTEDNVGVTGYKIYLGTESVDKDGEQYNLNFIEVGNVITHTIKDLDNGTEYFFALTALDAGKNESPRYSLEVKAKATANTSSADTTAPRVTEAVSLGNTSARIVFSEDVKLPATAPENAFVVEETLSGDNLEIISVRSDAANPEAVILTTAPQVLDRDYLVTVGIGVIDTVGNPVVSGISDTAVFKGQGAAGEEGGTDSGAEEDAGGDVVADDNGDSGGETDQIAPGLVSVVAISPEKIKITFSEEVLLDAQKPEENFLVYEKDAPIKTIEVNTATADQANGAVVMLETDVMIGGRIYVVEVVSVTDLAGNALSIENEANQKTFEALTGSLADLIPPEDVKNFVAKITDMVLTLSWTASLNLAGDLADQIMYMSTDKGAHYDQGKPLGPKATSYAPTGLENGKEYTFKLTMKDTSGNESEGLITSIFLPETGPGIAGLLALGSLGAGYVLSRKKKGKR